MDGPQKKKRRREEEDVPSTVPVEDIPMLPVDSTPSGAQRPTENNNDRNWMADPETAPAFSGSLVGSMRFIVKSEEAEIHMLNQAKTSVENVLSDFRSKVLEEVKLKRDLQATVPHINFPCHSLDKKGSTNDEPDTSESSDSDTSDGEEGAFDDPGRCRSHRSTREEHNEEMKTTAALMNMAVQRKKKHPNCLHPAINYNEENLRNDCPECRCPPPIQDKGLRHGYYAGEDKILDCSRTDLHYYTLKVCPAPNDAQNRKTQWNILRDIYTFEGFSLVTHAPLPQCITKGPISNNSMDYQFQLIEEEVPEGCFDPEDCDELFKYIFHEVFEMFNFQLRPKHVPTGINTCPVIHIMPRFECAKKDGSVYLWSTKTILAYFLYKKDEALFKLEYHLRLTPEEFDRNTHCLKQSILLNPQYKPSAVRADWFEKDEREVYFVHNAWMKLPTGPTEPRTRQILKLREPVTGYIDTGFKPDAVAHIAMAILACHHIRFNFSISEFERTIGYEFSDRSIIELAFNHSSFKINFGTPADHIKNLVDNCGYRRKYLRGEKKEKTKGLENLHNVMSGEADGHPNLDNERLEFLGDSVVQLIASHHLFFMFPQHLEGMLTTYRSALVQNRNLAKLAKTLRMDEMLQFAHGANLIYQPDFDHALANSFEAVIGAVYLDNGLGACDMIFSKAMYGSDSELKKIWDHQNEHELKREHPQGDRELIPGTPELAIFQDLENRIGYQFNNICLLAKAFTRREIPFSDLTKGHNQRLEWLGDSVLQLQISDFLFKNYPNHHEGHMTLLRTSLVCNSNLAIVFDDLGFLQFVVEHPIRGVGNLRMKDKADIVEAFIGALYVDAGIEHCKTFIRTVICSKLPHIIETEQWSDSKSQLQNLYLANQKSQNKENPVYRLISIEGPTSTRLFTVGVYFKEKRLATGTSDTVHNAEIRAAENALAGMGPSERKMVKKMTGRRRRRKRL